MRPRLFAVLLALASTTAAHAQRDLKNIPDPDPELERSTFIVADGFEVQLYAADPLIAKPIQMNFDERGRLWVASSEVYPHIKPGQEATDKILVLTDEDGDGDADQTTVFADNLLIPTGVVPGDGGAYVANSTELIHLRDTDGDGRADQRRVVLSGFGTEDTHHLLHTLRWGPDGCLYMNQSIYIHSHVETPYGVRHLNGGGIWRFRPETMELDVFCHGFVNPWGHDFDRWGQSFATDGAYVEGINYVFPGAVFFTAPNATRILHGLNPGSPKHCGLEITSGRHLPDDWQGNMITNDFRAHRVCRFVISEDRAGYTSRQETELIKSSHVAFRPIDVKMGPDGAIYVADWYNPIIQHGEVDFRDPRRDHVHGRIWRVVAKGRPLVEAPPLHTMSVTELLEVLKQPEAWNRQHAKLLLKQHDRAEVLAALNAWWRAPEMNPSEMLHHRLEALWAYQCLNEVQPELLDLLLAAPDHRVRAAAVRVAADWHERLEDPIALLSRRAVDEHPRVRLEAVRALALMPHLEAAEAAFAAIELPKDEFLDFALWATARDLAPVWLPALKAGKLRASVPQLTYALRALESPEVVAPLLELVRSGQVEQGREAELLRLAASLGDPPALQQTFQLALHEATGLTPDAQAAVLDELAQAARQRKTTPQGDLSAIGRLVQSPDAAVRQAALRLAGAWKVESLRGVLAQVAGDDQQAPPQRMAAVDALASLGGEATVQTLTKLVRSDATFEVRRQAVQGLAAIAPSAAAAHTVELLKALPADAEVIDVIRPLLARNDGASRLQEALQNQQLPADTAKQLLSAVRTLGRGDDALIAAVQQSGNLSEARWQLTPELLQQLTEQVQHGGDPHRGEAIYRRLELQCTKCHAIGGAGGSVGPDLISLGASAQVDYLIESLIEPNAKVKENFHSQVVLTAEGQLISGIPVRQNDRELVLRNAEDQEITIPADTIEEVRESRSLMPDGTVDPLTREELVDLVGFLSELGKVGEFAIGKEQYVRSWETLVWTEQAHHRLNRTSYDTAATDDPLLTWRPVYSRVAGDLPLDDLPTYQLHGGSPPTVFVRTTVEFPAAGGSLVFDTTEGLALWVNGNPTLVPTGRPLRLPQGSHRLTLAIDQRTSPPLRIRLEQ